MIDGPETTAIEATEFFDPATYEFETFGMAEELIDTTTFKVLGIRRVPKADRPIGSTGRIVIKLTERVPVQIGHKKGVIKASPKRPYECWASLFPLCGQKKEQAK